MNRFYIRGETKSAGAWVPMLLLWILAVAAWIKFSSLWAILLAVIGFIWAFTLRRKNHNRPGNFLEIIDKGLLFYQNDEHYCLAFDEIKEIKKSTLPPRQSSFVIETSTGKRIKIDPGYYENAHALRARLEKIRTSH